MRIEFWSEIGQSLESGIGAKLESCAKCMASCVHNVFVETWVSSEDSGRLLQSWEDQRCLWHLKTCSWSLKKVRNEIQIPVWSCSKKKLSKKKEDHRKICCTIWSYRLINSCGSDLCSKVPGIGLSVSGPWCLACKPCCFCWDAGPYHPFCYPRIQCQPAGGTGSEQMTHEKD